MADAVVVGKEELVFEIEMQLHSKLPSLAKASKADLAEMLDVIRRINGRVNALDQANAKLRRQRVKALLAG
jgi:hypothetical protein